MTHSGLLKLNVLHVTCTVSFCTCGLPQSCERFTLESDGGCRLLMTWTTSQKNKSEPKLRNWASGRALPKSCLMVSLFCKRTSSCCSEWTNSTPAHWPAEEIITSWAFRPNEIMIRFLRPAGFCYCSLKHQLCIFFILDEVKISSKSCYMGCNQDKVSVNSPPDWILAIVQRSCCKHLIPLWSNTWLKWQKKFSSPSQRLLSKQLLVLDFKMYLLEIGWIYLWGPFHAKDAGLFGGDWILTIHLIYRALQ